MLRIWMSTLNAEHVGLHDDFLDLGGDSLAAMRCVNQIKATFDVEVPLDLFFVEPASIAAVAAWIERVRSDTAEARELNG